MRLAGGVTTASGPALQGSAASAHTLSLLLTPEPW